MANPPFAGDIKESRILHQYDLGFKNKSCQRRKSNSTPRRDIL